MKSKSSGSIFWIIKRITPILVKDANSVMTVPVTTFFSRLGAPPRDLIVLLHTKELQ